jgi:redox-sensitive bicupin YhaK (pirin superfamily)
MRNDGSAHPSAAQPSLIEGWCFADHDGPDHVFDTGGMNISSHPHTGLQFGRVASHR